MSVRTWNTSSYGDLTIKTNWSGSNPLVSSDTFVMRQGVGYLININLGMATTLYLGTYESLPGSTSIPTPPTPVKLILSSAIASLNFGAFGQTDGNIVFGGRQANIDASGNSGAVMTSNAPGSAFANVSIADHSTFVGVQNFGAGPMTVRIAGSASGAYINLKSSLYNVTEAVDSYTTGTGTWDLWGNVRMSFVGGVASGQTVNLHSNSHLQLSNPQSFQGTLNIGDDFANYVFLMMKNPIVAADYVKDATTGLNTLRYTASNGQTGQLTLNDDGPKGFEIVGTSWGAAIVPNIVQDAPAGTTILLRHAGAPSS